MEYATLPDASIFWKGLCVWIFVTLGTYAIGRPKVKIQISDAWMIGLGATVCFWAIEATALWCHARHVQRPTPTEGFEDTTAASTDDPRAPTAAAPAALPDFGGHFGRSHFGLFSGDVVHISCPHPLHAEQRAYFQRDLFQSEIIMGPESQMNLSKVRFVLPEHDSNRLQPLHYRQTVYWMHSAYADNKNDHRFYVKRSKTLVSHQTGTFFRAFMLVNPEKPEDQGPVQIQGPVHIVALAEQGLPEAYLRVREDRRIDDGAGSEAGKATPFLLAIQRPAEPSDHHLMIAPSEPLFP